MKKFNLKLAATVMVCGAFLFSSCIGSFALHGKLLSWNQGVSNKFVNELVFLAFNIIPVYGVCYLADALVINSIEFWSARKTSSLTNLLPMPWFQFNSLLCKPKEPIHELKGKHRIPLQLQPISN